jgi:preprotein translocase subunit SecA
MHIELAPPEQQPALQPAALPPMEGHHVDLSTGMDEMALATAALAGATARANGALAEARPQPQQARRNGKADPRDPTTWGKVSRNAPCPCGSGKKYKHCHGKHD